MYSKKKNNGVTHENKSDISISPLIVLNSNSIANFKASNLYSLLFAALIHFWQLSKFIYRVTQDSSENQELIFY